MRYITVLVVALLFASPLLAETPCDFKGISVGSKMSPAQLMSALGVTKYKTNPPPHLRITRKRGDRDVLCRGAACAPLRYDGVCRTQWRRARCAAAAAPRARDRPVRLSRPHAGEARRLHERELQGAGSPPRSEPSARQPEWGNVQSLFGTLPADLGQGVRASGRRTAAGPGSGSSGPGEFAGRA